MNQTFEDNKDTILFITGGAGFIGSNFINELFNQYNYIKVINFDALYYCANKENVNEVIRNNNERYTFIHGNLQSFDFLTPLYILNQICFIVIKVVLLTPDKFEDKR